MGAFIPFDAIQPDFDAGLQFNKNACIEIRYFRLMFSLSGIELSNATRVIPCLSWRRACNFHLNGKRKLGQCVKKRLVESGFVHIRLSPGNMAKLVIEHHRTLKSDV